MTSKQLKDLKVQVEKCFKAAALAAGCEVKITWAPWGQIDGLYLNGIIAANSTTAHQLIIYKYVDVFTNEVFADLWIGHMKDLGFKFFARQEEESLVSGSTDMGNFTNAVPGIHAG